jgi:type I restriction enzyme M protein
MEKNIPLSTFPLSRDDNLLKKFEEIHDFIYANDGLSTQQTLEEFVKILFLKTYDENTSSNYFYISPEEWKDIESGKLAPSFSSRVQELFELTKNNFSDLFLPDDRIKLSSLALGHTINKLCNTSLLDSSNDAKGLAFQKFLSRYEKDSNGQFFTPEPIIDFSIKFLQPSLGETLIDPACGSGGFLLASINSLKESNPDFEIQKYISNFVYGIDINNSIARIAKMKLLLTANVPTNINCYSSLDDLDKIKNLFQQKDGFDIVLTNPPFGAKINNSSVLSKYDLGHKWITKNGLRKTKNVLVSQSAEILFIERCLQLLKVGGRMGIVLPNGNFENPSLEYLRTYIKGNAKIISIISLPQETFIPYGAGVKTSILFLEKRSTTNNYTIFYGRIQKLGYQGNKNGTPIYKKDELGNIEKNSNGNPSIDEDFNLTINSYHKYIINKSIDTENAFSINFNQLKDRLDFDLYSPENRKLMENFKKHNSVKLGDICEILRKNSIKLKNLNLSIDYIELSDINTLSFEIINSTNYLVHQLPARASYELEEGDIITAIAGNSIGTNYHATALVTRDYQGSICTNGFKVLRNFKLDPYYLLYYLRSDYFLRQILMYRTGAVIPYISDIDLSNIIIYLPNEKIQTEISLKVKKAIELRQEAKKELSSIDFKFS